MSHSSALAFDRGWSTAIGFPLAAILGLGIVDFGLLRDFALTAAPEVIGRTLLSLSIVGFLLGAGVGPMIDRMISNSLERDIPFDLTPNRPADGARLSSNELIALEAVLNEREHQAVQDLLESMARPEMTEGSELLDRRVLRVLRMEALRIKPTRSVEDAQLLTRLRAGGAESNLEWRTRRHPNRCQPLVIIEARPAVPRPRRSDEFLHVAEGSAKTEALALTRAVLQRETLIYSRQAGTVPR